jgi:hypothetical protein
MRNLILDFFECLLLTQHLQYVTILQSIFFTGRFLSTSCQLEWDSLKVVYVKITKSRNMFGTFNISKLIRTSNMICNKKMKFHHSEDTFKITLYMLLMFLKFCIHLILLTVFYSFNSTNYANKYNVVTWIIYIMLLSKYNKYRVILKVVQIF